MLFAGCDRSSPIKNVTDRLNLRELQVDDYQPNLLQKVQFHIYQSGKSGFK